MTELTKRELEVLRLIADGKEDPEIAKLLFITSGTASNHARNILIKLGANTRANAVDLAYKQNILNSTL